MNKYNFSIIIPHKDIPELLMRCLRSIPLRDDIQVIVVDDNSSGAERYKEKYPELSRPYLEFYATKEGKGAGYARNIGLKHAKGKWLLFADADDFFMKNMENLLDKYLHSDSDIVYFDSCSVKSNNIQEDDNWTDAVSTKRFRNGNADAIRYTHLVPWAKIIRRNLVTNNDICFDEIQWCNDIFFSVKVGCLARIISISKDVLYVYTRRQGSLSDSSFNNPFELKTRAKAAIRTYLFAKAHGYRECLFICTFYLSRLLSQGMYLTFMKTIHMLDNESINNFYLGEKRALNWRGKMFLLFFVLLGKYIPWPNL